MMPLASISDRTGAMFSPRTRSRGGGGGGGGSLHETKIRLFPKGA